MTRYYNGLVGPHDWPDAPPEPPQTIVFNCEDCNRPIDAVDPDIDDAYCAPCAAAHLKATDAEGAMRMWPA